MAAVTVYRRMAAIHVVAGELEQTCEVSLASVE